MHRIKKTFLANGDFILPCVKSVLFSMLGAAFLGNGEICSLFAAYDFSAADYYNASETGQVIILK